MTGDPFAFNKDAALGILFCRTAGAAPVEFLFELFKDNQSQNLCQWPESRYSAGDLFAVAVNPPIHFDKAVDQAKQVPVRQAASQACDQLIVRGFIEKSLYLGWKNPAVTFFQQYIDLAHDPIDRMLGLKDLAIRFPLRLYNLYDGLLDKTIHHGRNAKQTNFSVCTRQLNTHHRLRPIGDSGKLGSQTGPMLLEVIWQLIGGHAVDARCFIALVYSFQRQLDVVALQDAQEQGLRFRSG